MIEIYQLLISNKTMKDIVIGLGEIGKPIYQLLSKKNLVVGYDLNSNLMDSKKFEKLSRCTVFLWRNKMPLVGASQQSQQGHSWDSEQGWKHDHMW